MTDNALGEFLQVRRGRLTPADVGLPSYGRRRVKGLRREEVAVSAGMNTDYYARLEQGRERSPSAQILDALASALKLGEEEHAHLFRLAGVVQPRRTLQPDATVDPALAELLAAYSTTPALVLNPALDILMANTLAQELFSPFRTMDNLAYMTFLDPAGVTFYPNWDSVADSTVASMHHAFGVHPDFPRLHEVVATLEQSGGRFSDFWSHRRVSEKTSAAKDFMHPEVGPVTLTYRTFDVRGAHGQQVVIYHAEPGSPSADALVLLGALNATAHGPST